MAREFVYYAGRRFWLQTTGRYFQSGEKTDSERLLHRRIWVDNFGPIPAGHEIHHKDEDWRNNSVGNLELRKASDHRREHMLKKWQDPVAEAKMRAGLEEARKAAPTWHASPEGREWHSKNGLAAWENRKWYDATCTVCDTTYKTPFPDRARYCTKACENKAVQARHQETRTCVQCGAEFLVFKYTKKDCCSRGCAVRRRSGHPPTNGKPPARTRKEAAQANKSMPATCQNCGAEFKYDRHAKHVPKTCSPKCRGELRKKQRVAP